MRNLKDEIRNRVNKLSTDDRNVASLLQMLHSLDEEVGKSICDCLNAKSNALKGTKDDLKVYIDYATQRLQESMEMTILFRVMLGKLLHGLVAIDKEGLKHGNVPVLPMLMEGRVELK